MDTKDRKKRERKMFSLQGLIFTLANWLLSDLAIEAKLKKQVHGISYIGRDLSKYCSAYRKKGFPMPAGRLGRALKAVGRTKAGVVPSIIIRDWERAGNTEHPAVKEWLADWSHIGTLANVRAQDWRIHEPGEMRWVPGKGNIWVSAEEPTKPVAVVNRQAWSDINFNRIDNMERATRTLLVRSHGVRVYRLSDDAKKSISEVRTLVNDWVAVNHSVFPIHPLTRQCLKITDETNYSMLSSREGEVNWVRFRGNVNALNFECGNAMRKPVDPKPEVKPEKSADAIAGGKVDGKPDDEPISSHHPQGWSDVNFQRIDKMERATTTFIIQSNGTGCDPMPDDVRKGIGKVRTLVNDWLDVNQNVLPLHPLTQQCVKIVADTAYTMFDKSFKNGDIDIYWQEFRANVNALSQECIKAMREPKEPKPEKSADAIAGGLVERESEVLADSHELAKKPTAEMVGFREQLYPDIENPADKQDAEPEPQVWSGLNFNRIDKLERAATSFIIRSNGVSVSNLPDDVRKVISEVRTLMNDWIAVNEPPFPVHPLTRQCFKIVAQTDYVGLRSGGGEVNWVRFRENVNALSDICRQEMRGPKEPKPEKSADAIAGGLVEREVGAVEDAPLPAPEDDPNLISRECDTLAYDTQVLNADRPDVYTLNNDHVIRIDQMLGTINGFHRVIEGLECEDVSSPNSVDEGILTVRKANLSWLESYQKDLPHHPITQACIDVALCHFGEFDTRQKRLYSNDEWQKFRDRVSILRKAGIAAIHED